MTKTIAKEFKKVGIEPVYADGYVSLPIPTDEKPGREGAKAWFVYNPDSPSDFTTYLDPVTWSGSVEALIALEEMHGPFDGVLGFSQGAVAAHILLASQPLKNPFKFGVMISGFAAKMPLPFDRPDHALGPGPELIEVPSVHVSGKMDTSVPPHHQKELAARFLNPVLFEHEKGHIVGLSPKEVLNQFVAEIVKLANR